MATKVRRGRRNHPSATRHRRYAQAAISEFGLTETAISSWLVVVVLGALRFLESPAKTRRALEAGGVFARGVRKMAILFRKVAWQFVRGNVVFVKQACWIRMNRSNVDCSKLEKYEVFYLCGQSKSSGVAAETPR
jgi:hypothetical protein